MKSFDSLIGPETRAALADAERLKSLVSRTMPPQAVDRLVFCRLQAHRLRLVLDSAAWVARLRFNERQMVRALSAEGLQIRQVSWHVAPPYVPPAPPTREARKPRDGRTAALVASVAEDMDDDDLRRALTRLAERLQVTQG